MRFQLRGGGGIGIISFKNINIVWGWGWGWGGDKNWGEIVVSVGRLGGHIECIGSCS